MGVPPYLEQAQTVDLKFDHSKNLVRPNIYISRPSFRVAPHLAAPEPDHAQLRIYLTSAHWAPRDRHDDLNTDQACLLNGPQGSAAEEAGSPHTTHRSVPCDAPKPAGRTATLAEPQSHFPAGSPKLLPVTVGEPLLRARSQAQPR